MQAIAMAGEAIIRTVGPTWRIRRVNERYLDEARRHCPNVIFVVWHGRLMPISYSHRDLNIHILASEHRDGETLGQTIRRLGFGHVRGSSTRGGARAIREMVRVLRSGHDIGFTVDGPKGPRYVVKPGPAQIAKLTGAAIVPITSSSRRHKTLSSWDAFELPYPFTSVRIACGTPVVVPRDASESMVEDKRLEVERILNEITEENDRAVHG